MVIIIIIRIVVFILTATISMTSVKFATKLTKWANYNDYKKELTPS